ncbi:MAG: 2-oxoisovalerate dehydrogenase [Anaerolineae bacterium]|nr:2-oxoisovalerate dehydrogenase [Anaerolineae bacterium]
MHEITFIVEPDVECGYRAKALGYAIFTQGNTIEKLKAMVLDAVQCHFDKADMPRLIRLKLSE